MKYLKGIIFLNEKSTLLLIFIIALVLRILMVINLPLAYQIPACDAFEYDDLAINLLTGKGFIYSGTNTPTSLRVPMYPIFLATIYFFFGHNYFAVRIIQSIIGALLCIIIFKIAKIIYDKKTAFLSALILAFYQPYIFYSWHGGPAFLLSENLFNIFLALFVFFVLKGFFLQYSLGYSIMAGVLLGLLTLTRPIMALFPLFLFCLLLHRGKYVFLSVAKNILPLLVAFILVILPWTVRNCLVHKAFVPLSTEGGLCLFAGNNPQAKGGGLVQPQIDYLLTQKEQEDLGKMSEFKKDNLYRRHAWQFLIKNYRVVPKLFLKKILVMWDVYEPNYDLQSNGPKRFYNIWYSLIFIFSLFGILKSIKLKTDSYSLLLLLLIYYSVIAMIFAGHSRLRYPTEPYLIIFAAGGILQIYNSFRNKLLSYIVISIIIGINFLLAIYADILLNFVGQIINFLLI